MNLLRLSLGIIWRMAFWGLVSGTGFGGIYGYVVIFVIQIRDTGNTVNAPDIPNMPGVALVGLLYGGIFGGIGGLFLGLVDGIIIALIASFDFYPITKTNIRRFRVVTGAWCALTILCLIAFFTVPIGRPFDARGIGWMGIMLFTLGVALAIGASIWGCFKVSSWLESKSATDVRTIQAS